MSRRSAPRPAHVRKPLRRLARRLAALALASLAFGGIGTFAGPAAAAPVRQRAPLHLELTVTEPAIPRYGVVAGRLTLENRGAEEVRTGPLSVHAGGRLAFEIEQPDGSVLVIANRDDEPGPPAWGAALLPGTRALRPICLVKVGGRPVFEQMGEHRIRAVCQPPPVYGRRPSEAGGERERVLLRSFQPVASNWVTVRVGPAGDGADLFRSACAPATICDPFVMTEALERERQRLHRFLDYRHEMVKLLLLQYHGDALRDALSGRIRPGPRLEESADIMLAMAEAAGITEDLWRWIVASLRYMAEHAGDRSEVTTVRRGWVI